LAGQWWPFSAWLVPNPVGGEGLLFKILSYCQAGNFWLMKNVFAQKRAEGFSLLAQDDEHHDYTVDGDRLDHTYDDKDAGLHLGVLADCCQTCCAYKAKAKAGAKCCKAECHACRDKLE
jgi:hypothetical protein